MDATGTGEKATGFDISTDKASVISKKVSVPKGAKNATILAVAHLTTYNDKDGGAGFLYIDVFAGDDFGTEEYADFDSEKWNNLSASNQTVLNVADLKHIPVELHVRADEALSLNPDLTSATLNAIVVFEY